MTDILSYGTNELFEEVARHEEMGSEIRALWPLQEIADKGLVEGFRKLVELYPSHIQKEDYLLIPMAEKMLSESEQE